MGLILRAIRVPKFSFGGKKNHEKRSRFEHQFFTLQKTNRRLFMLLIFSLCLTVYAVMNTTKLPLVVRISTRWYRPKVKEL